MWEMLRQFFVIFLIIYFVFDSAEKIVQYKRQNKNKEKVIIIKVKNRSCDIEGIIRGVVWKCLKESFGGYIPYIFVVDMGCEDDTMEIVRRLGDEYDFLIPMTLDEFNQIRRM